MNNNVFEFKRKSVPTDSQQSEPAAPAVAVAEMLKQSSAMTVLATLAFYADQGFDHGHRARAAMPALSELLATKGIAVVQQPN